MTVTPFYACLVCFLFVFFYLWTGKKRRVTASHILVKEESTAKRLLRQLTEIKEEQDLRDLFFMLAENVSECPSGKEAGGSLGSFGPGEMDPVFDKACWDADIGKVYGPVHTAFGYHLIIVHERYTDEEETKKRR